MAMIQDYLNSIMKAVYGKDVRRSIHDYRWFTTFNSMSYYPVLFSPNSTNNNAQIAMAGMNGMHTNKKGMCFCPNIINADGKEVSPSTAVYPAASEVITEEGE